MSAASEVMRINQRQGRPKARRATRAKMKHASRKQICTRRWKQSASGRLWNRHKQFRGVPVCAKKKPSGRVQGRPPRPRPFNAEARSMSTNRTQAPQSNIACAGGWGEGIQVGQLRCSQVKGLLFVHGWASMSPMDGDEVSQGSGRI